MPRFVSMFLSSQDSECEIRASSAGPAINVQYKELNYLVLRECRLFLFILFMDVSDFSSS